MFVIIGYVVILSAVLGGFILAGGHVHSLIQPTEFLTIGGSALGQFLVANPPTVVKATLAAVPSVLKGSHFNKALYMDLLAMLYEILSKVRKEGLMSIEGDVENPESSPIFTKYPVIAGDHHAMEFLCDYLRMMVGGNLNAFEIENLMDNEIETHHHEGEVPIHAMAKIADGLPAFGIVAHVACAGTPPAVDGSTNQSP